MNRRTFLQHSTTGIAIGSFAPLSIIQFHDMQKPKSIHIARVDSNFEREPLRRPFGFKGAAMRNVWQIINYLESSSGKHAIGLGTQNVLWSDSSVFAKHSENGGNALMYAISERALQMINGESFNDPISLLDDILEEVYDYGKSITQNENLRKTFALNALVGLDNAAWLLYAFENGYSQFDQMIPKAYQQGISARHPKVVSIPALGYGTDIKEIKGLADEGFFIMKIKIGAPGTQSEMLEKDKAFLKSIHDAIGHYENAYSQHGKIPYYFDANGRYDSKDDMHRFLDYAEKIGALEQIAVLEEPFGERNQGDVYDIVDRGLRVAADESAHTDEDALARIEQGYNSIAVKAIAKTLSMTLKIAQVAYNHKVPCFCADLTVNPILVDWNKCIAARLPAFPELPNLGLQETNGWQNYANWDEMMSYHPGLDASWVKPSNGTFDTGKKFMEESGGIFTPSEHYEKMFR